MNFPQEIIDHIVSFLPERINQQHAALAHKANLALVNKAWNSAATPVLYRCIDISEDTYIMGQFKDRELYRMDKVTLALAKNPYISSLVQELRHGFYFKPQTGVSQRQEWEISLVRIRSLLQDIIDRNGFPRVRKLVLHYPDIDIAGILLEGLLPQIHSLQVTSPFFKDLHFDAENPLGFSNLVELELEFTPDTSRTGRSRALNEQIMLKREWKLMDENMHCRINAFLSCCPSLQVLKIRGAKELHALLQSVTFPSLKVLEIGQVLNHQTDFAIICLNSFLARHPTIARLALYKLPSDTSHVLNLSGESALNIREFVSCIEELPADYFTFLRQFRKLETYRLEHHVFVGEILHDELLNMLLELGHHSPGIKNLTLPMPTHISGWTLTNEKQELARKSLMEFGEALSENVPTVEKLGVNQIGKFACMNASEWALSLSSHPCLRSIAIKTSFFSAASAVEPEGNDRQEIINNLAKEFAIVPRLESFIFLGGTEQRAVKVTIARMEDGTVEGIEEFGEVEEEVDKVFLDDFFDSGW